MSPQQRTSSSTPRRLVVLLATLALATSACDVAQITSADSADVVPVREGDTGWPDADWTLLDASLDGDILTVRLQYPGGCAIHEFDLLAVGGWIDLPDAGPTPTVAMELRIAHDDHGDRCEALLTEVLRFDLSPLRAAYRRDRGTGPARVILRLPVAQGATDTVSLDWML